MLTKLNSSQYSFTNNQTGTMTLNTTVSFRYYIFVGTVLSTPNDLMLELTFQFMQTGITKLDSNSNVPLSNLQNFTNNTIVFYVDQKNNRGISNGSFEFPYTTISSALANIVTPAINSDPRLADRFIIHVVGGMYNESLTIPGFRHITFVADGLVFLGSTTL